MLRLLPVDECRERAKTETADNQATWAAPAFFIAVWIVIPAAVGIWVAGPAGVRL
ncbi:MAG: hypothetical protein JXD23_13310 [Spirochaetales bacterium]|nr:hypothetical protein [Spirochaetales bacterium]